MAGARGSVSRYSASAAPRQGSGERLVDKGSRRSCKTAQEDQKKKPPTETSSVTLPKWLGVITPFGDVRLRDEGFYGNTLHARTRFRLRARMRNITDDHSNGSPGQRRCQRSDLDEPDPLEYLHAQTDQPRSSLPDLEARKSFRLKPVGSWGEVRVNAYRVSELVFDDDLSPEGVRAANLWERKTGFLRAIRLNALEWLLDELAADKDLGGGQAIVETALGNAATWNLAFADFSFVTEPGRRQVPEPVQRPANEHLRLDRSLAKLDVVKNSKGKIIGYKSGFNVINGATD